MFRVVICIHDKVRAFQRLSDVVLKQLVDCDVPLRVLSDSGNYIVSLDYLVLQWALLNSMLSVSSKWIQECRI